MFAPQWRPDERLANMGLTFVRERQFRRLVLSKGGAVDEGWNTSFALVPEEDLAVLVHLNLTFERSAGIAARILQTVLNAEHEAPLAAATDPALLASAPGVYEAPSPGPLTNARVAISTGRVQISERDGGLMLHSRRGAYKDGTPLLAADPNDPTFFRLDDGGLVPNHVALRRDGAGGVRALLLTGIGEVATQFVRNDAIDGWA